MNGEEGVVNGGQVPTTNGRVVKPPLIGRDDKDTTAYKYDLAPADFPPPPEHDEADFEVTVPPEDIVLSALACNTLDWCQRIDYSTTTPLYEFQTFPFVIPTEWILGAMTVGVFGLFVVSYYALTVISRDCGTPRMIQIATYIRQGSEKFLVTEYTYLFGAVAAITIILVFINTVDGVVEWRLGVCYLIGALLSGITGYIGMSIATRGNVRTTAASEQGLSLGLNVAFRSGAVMGLSVVSIGLTGLGLCYLAFGDVRALAGFSAGASTIALFARVGGGIYTKAADVGADLVGKVEASIPEDDPRNPATIADNVGDNVGDVAGMGADLFESFVGSIIATAILGATLPYFYENPFAMCVYQHLNIDLACGSSDPPFNTSFANSICSTDDFYLNYPSLGRLEGQGLFILLPFALAMVGVAASALCTQKIFYFGGEVKDKAKTMSKLLQALNISIFLASFLIFCAAFGLTFGLFGGPSAFLDNSGFGFSSLPYYAIQTGDNMCEPRLDNPDLPLGSFRIGYYRPTDAIGFLFPVPLGVWARLFGCIVIGLLLGIFIGEITQFFTSGNSTPTQGIAASGEYGAGAVVIQGLGVGMASAVLPLFLVFGSILGTYALFSSYGIGLAAVGMLSSLGITMATDAYGPVADNAGGIAEMAELPPHVRDTTDALDALGNTTAAIGKGFSNGSAVLTAYALLTALIQDSGLMPGPVSLVADPPGSEPENFVYFTDPISLDDVYVITSLLLGIMLPFLFGALTMLAVSSAAEAMIVEVRRQFREVKGLREGKPGVRPEHEKCIAISTQSALWEMVLPGIIAIMSPLIIGFGFGQRALVGLLLGAIGSGYMLGIMMSNAGGAWDNAKKLVESGFFGKVNSKGSEWHKATVAGDTVGDPFKDTSGPSMNILIKMMTVFGLVFVPKMTVGLEQGWIGLVLGGATLLVAAFFTYLKIRSGARLAKEARKKTTDDDEGAPLVAPDAESPFVEAGTTVPLSRVNRKSALYSDNDAGDVVNLSDVMTGTREVVDELENADDLDEARGVGVDPSKKDD
ncbi:hypothetical protein NDN08_003860 [Rhodosorus marinus]|uniref:H(+)-exporting diphosphatase n=1 Tax=Rhodosorus marinus TaxID=101924 RepID=A0AAV8UGN5_9RHOD|nr:hypothetical protein NDN08_003860 [Rhodosorus marinus]